MECATVSLDTLPEYGLFWTIGTGRRGLIRTWHYKNRKKWSAVCLLFQYTSGRLGAIVGRFWIHAGAMVSISLKDGPINAPGRGDTGDSFLRRGFAGTCDTTLRRQARSAGRFAQQESS